MRRRKAAFALGAVSVVLAVSQAAAGQFAATVNGVGIPRDRLEASVNAYLSSRGTGFQFMTQPAQYKEVRRQVLEALIGQELLWQEARKKGLTASDDEVDRAVARIRERLPSPENFQTELMIGGFTEASYAEHVRRQLSLQRLIREEIAGNVAVTEEEIEAFYRDHPEKTDRPEKVRVREQVWSGKVAKAVEDRVERLRAAAEVRIMEPR